MYINKKPHTKSRGGCQGCKRRKIKCDEARPRCTFCEKRKQSCNYEVAPSKITTRKVAAVSSANSSASSRGSSPGSASQLQTLMTSLYGHEVPRDILGNSVPLRMGGMDVMLMHQYSQFTHLSLSVYKPLTPIMIATWRVEIPRLAVEHDFLRNAVLGTSSLHLQALCPQDAAFVRQSAVYQDKAFRGFRQAVSNITPKNSQAVLATSVLLLFLAIGQQSKDNMQGLWIIDWMGLHIGLISLISALGWQEIIKSCISPIFQMDFNPFKLNVMLPRLLRGLTESIDDQDPEQPHVATLNSALLGLGRLYARLLQKSCITWELSLEIVAWPSQLSTEFTSLARSRRPRALVIIAHYLVFLSLMQHLWWVKGISAPQIQVINHALEPQWRSWVDLPNRAMTMDNQDFTIALLLGQLDGVRALEN